MHKNNRDLINGKAFDDKDYVIEETPIRHHSRDDVLSKKTTTIRTASDEITTQMPMIEEITDTDRYLTFPIFDW